MDSLFFIPGLYQLRCRRIHTAKYQRDRALAPNTDPRIAHESGISADRLDAEIIALSEQIEENVTSIEGIEHLIRLLTSSPHKSADRTLAIRHLEDASMRLRRELSTEDHPQ